MLKKANYGFDYSALQAFVNQDDANKEDYQLEGHSIEFTKRKTLAIVTKHGTEEFSFNDYSFKQTCAQLGIPANYLGKCRPDGPGGQIAQFQAQMEEKRSQRFLLRVRRQPVQEEGVAGTLRAFLPGTYTPFDARDLLRLVQGSSEIIRGSYALKESSLKKRSSANPDHTFQLRFVGTEAFNLAGGDEHAMGFHLKTSELGAHPLRMDTLVYRQICTNGMMGWRDSPYIQIKHDNLVVHEVHPQIREAIAAVKLQQAPVADMLSEKYSVRVEDPETAIYRAAISMKLKEELTDAAVQAFKKHESHAGNNVFTVMNAFTRAAQGLDEEARLKMEHKVGVHFLGGKDTLKEAA